jgi:hypothetical protein
LIITDTDQGHSALRRRIPPPSPPENSPRRRRRINCSAAAANIDAAVEFFSAAIFGAALTCTDRHVLQQSHMLSVLHVQVTPA